jgi:hypothetical protein
LKKPFGKLVTVSALMAFLLSSFLVAGGLNKAEAQESDSSDVSAASGSNRFVVWQDGTPGNSDIFFRRSTDNGATWKSIVNLSKNPGNSISPQIAVSGSNVYVVWTQASANEEEDAEADIFLRRSTDNGATWGSKINISMTSSPFSSGPRVVASGSNVYTTWVDDNGVFIRRSTDNGATWQPKVDFSNTVNAPEVAVSGSNVYIVWEDGNDIQLSRSTDGGATWKAAENISNNAGESASPHIAASGSNVHVAWENLTAGNGDILYRRSTDNGATWKSIVNLSNNPGDSRNSQLTVSGSKVYVVWTQFSSSGECEPSDIFFRGSTNNGATWGSKIKISSSGTNFGFLCTGALPEVAASGSNVYISWRDGGADDVFFRRSIDSGATWKSIVNLSNNAGTSDNPQIIAVGSNVFIAWTDSTPGNRDILLKRSTDSGATWKAVKNLSNNSGNSNVPEIGA